MRAIEQGLPVIRAANTGISAIIDSHGRYLQQPAADGKGVVIDSACRGDCTDRSMRAVGDLAAAVALYRDFR